MATSQPGSKAERRFRKPQFASSILAVGSKLFNPGRDLDFLKKRSSTPVKTATGSRMIIEIGIATGRVNEAAIEAIAKIDGVRYIKAIAPQ